MRRRTDIRAILLLPAIVVVILCFLTAVSRVETGQKAEGKIQLEETLRQAAAACYAAEGAYPPDLAYMQEHYGIRINEEEYTVIYEVIASNLMPDITVLERVP